MFRNFTATAILALTLATAAQAGPAIVRFDDLDLSRPQDNRVLNSRIHDAATTACAGLRDARPSLLYKVWFENCVRRGSNHLAWQIAALSPNKSLAVASK
jgi:UrcA family protein